MRGSVSFVSLLLIALFVTGCSSESKIKRHVARGDRFYESARYEEAEIEYLNAYKLAPNHPRVIGQLGLIYEEQGRTGVAHSFLTAARDLDPENLTVRVRLGFFFLAVNEPEKAREEALFVLERMPSHSEAMLLLAESSRTPEEVASAHLRFKRLVEIGGESVALHLARATLHFRLGETNEAEIEIKKALALDSKSSAAHFALGNLYWNRQDLVRADTAFQSAAELASARSVRRLKYADFKIATGDSQAGEAILKRINAESRDYLPAWLRRAELAITRKAFSDCDAFLQQVLSRDKGNFDALLLRARLRLLQGDKARAIEELEALSNTFRQSPFAHFHLGLAYSQVNDLPKALASLRQAVALAPGLPDVALALAQVHMQRRDLSEVIALLEGLIVREPRLPDAYLLLGNAYRAAGRSSDALGSFEKLAELLPNEPQVPVLQGLILSDLGRLAEARHAFETSLAISNGYLPALERIVAMDLAENQADEALERIKHQMKGKTHSPHLEYLSSKVFLAKGESGQAESALRKAIELDPAFASAYLALAELYLAQKSQKQASRTLNSLLEKEPGNVAALVMLAEIQSDQKDYEAVRATYETLLANDPSSVAVLNNLAYIYSEKLGDSGKALELAEQARRLAPDHPQVAHTYGWILCKQGDYRKGIGLLQESAGRLPHNAEVQFHLGVASHMLGHEAQARDAFKRVQSLENSVRWRDQADEWLAILDMDPDSINEESLSKIEQWLVTHPGDPVALLRLGAYHERRHDVASSIAAYENGLKQNALNVAILLRLSRVLYQTQGDLKKRGLELARQALKLAPDNPEVCLLLGRMVYEEGDHRWAVTLLEKGAISYQADTWDLALAYLSVGRVDEAEGIFGKLSEAGETPALEREARQILRMLDAWRNRVVSAEALADARTLLAENERTLPARLVLAAAAEENGKIESARDYYAQALAWHREFAPARKRLALLYGRKPENWEKAYEYSQQALRSYPDDSEVTKAFAIACYHRGEFRRSIQLLERELTRSNDPELFYYLGMAKFSVKERAESSRHLQQALALSTNAPFAMEARKVLETLR